MLIGEDIGDKNSPVGMSYELMVRLMQCDMHNTFGRTFLIHEVQLIDEASRSLRPVVGDALLMKEGSPACRTNLYCRRR